MATLSDAENALEQAQRRAVSLFGAIPVVLGIRLGRTQQDFGLRVMLSQPPQDKSLPRDVAGVPVEYLFGEAVALGREPAWLAKVKAATARSRAAKD